MTKVCNKCHKEKDVSEFCKNKHLKDGLNDICRECQKEKWQLWYVKNKDKRRKYKQKNKKHIKKQNHKWYYENHEERLVYGQNYRDTHKEESKQYHQKVYPKYKEYFKLKARERRKNNLDEVQKYEQRYYLENKEKISQRNKEYRQKNKDKRNQKLKNRRKTDIDFRILTNLRTRVCGVLNGKIKEKTTLELLSCDKIFIRKWLELQFTDGMSWENYGNGWYGKGMQEWHIDHIYPLSSFNLKKKSEQKIAFHWSNLQPLWAKENLIKNDKH